MPQLQVSPTRAEYKKALSGYTTARKGHKLLKDKRDELMRHFLKTVKEGRELREKVETRLGMAYRSFVEASAVSSRQILLEALIMPIREGGVEVTERNVMGVSLPQYRAEFTKSPLGAQNYGLAFTPADLDTAVESISALADDLIRLAELEKSVELLADEIEKTRRRVCALEYIIMPRYLGVMRSIRMKLDENERGNTTRLMKVKDMMLQKRAEGGRSADTYGENE